MTTTEIVSIRVGLVWVRHEQNAFPQSTHKKRRGEVCPQRESVSLLASVTFVVVVVVAVVASSWKVVLSWEGIPV